jgi:hypothetical protein
LAGLGETSQGLDGPALLVIGEVAAMADIQPIVAQLDEPANERVRS